MIEQGAAETVLAAGAPAASLGAGDQPYRELLEALGYGCAFCELIRDAAGVVVDVRYADVNGVFERQAGRAREQLAGHLESEVEAFGRGWLVRGAGALAAGERRTFELHGGGDRWYEVTVLARPGDRVVVVAAEVTARRQLEAALRATELQEHRDRLRLATREADLATETAIRAKDEFLAVLSHELRTPLAPILLWARQLRAGRVPMSELGRVVDAIVESADSQARLIEGLLDLSRLTSGRMQLVRRATDVEAVVRAACELVRGAAEAKHVDVSVSVEHFERHPSLDPQRLGQVLRHLLSNAVTFTPEHGGITVRAQRTGGELVVEIADTGQGIDAALLPQLFDRFRQGDMADTRAHGGLGIGLALSRRLVELHGGDISARSEGPGRGAVFTVRLPWIEPQVDELGPAALAGLRALIVEDDLRERGPLVATLEAAGAHVQAVASAGEALAALAAPGAPDAPEVIVCALALPGVDGYELISRVGELFRAFGREAPPSCALSSDGSAADRARAIAAGFDIYVPKPVSAERLLEAVEELAAVARSGELLGSAPPGP